FVRGGRRGRKSVAYRVPDVRRERLGIEGDKQYAPVGKQSGVDRPRGPCGQRRPLSLSAGLGVAANGDRACPEENKEDDGRLNESVPEHASSDSVTLARVAVALWLKNTAFSHADNRMTGPFEGYEHFLASLVWCRFAARKQEVYQTTPERSG